MRSTRSEPCPPSLPMPSRPAGSCLAGICQQCQPDYSYQSYCYSNEECCNGALRGRVRECVCVRACLRAEASAQRFEHAGKAQPVVQAG